MDDEEDNFDVEAWKANKQATFEEKIISVILNRLKPNLKGIISHLKRQCESVTGTKSLNWDFFIQEFPSFPVRIFPKSIPYVHQITLNDLFNRFTKISLYNVVLEILEQYSDELEEQPFALVFNWPHMGGLMAFHNYLTNHDSSETRIIRRLNLNPQPITLVLEKLTSLLDVIGETWR